MALPTRAQQVGWVVLLTALGVLAAVRMGCSQAAAVGTGGDPGTPSTASLAPEIMHAGGGRG